MTKTLGVAVVLGLIGTGAAFAQTTATSTSTTPPAVSSPVVISTSPDAGGRAPPVAGANSFTASEARSRIEANGYTNVTGLAKDNQSIWRGKAMKGGTPVNVALDFQGNIVAD